MAAVSIFFNIFQPWWDICLIFMFCVQIAFLVINAKRSLLANKKHEYAFLNRIDVREEMCQKLENDLPEDMPEELKRLTRQFFGLVAERPNGDDNQQPRRVFPPPGIPDEFFYKYRFKCIHCEDVVLLPPHLLKSLPQPMAMCPYGAKTKIKEWTVGLYDCLLEEEIIEEQEVDDGITTDS